MNFPFLTMQRDLCLQSCMIRQLNSQPKSSLTSFQLLRLLHLCDKTAHPTWSVASRRCMSSFNKIKTDSINTHFYHTKEARISELWSSLIIRSRVLWALSTQQCCNREKARSRVNMKEIIAVLLIIRALLSNPSNPLLVLHLWENRRIE
jgi:hypothetical protein